MPKENSSADKYVRPVPHAVVWSFFYFSLGIHSAIRMRNLMCFVKSGESKKYYYFKVSTKTIISNKHIIIKDHTIDYNDDKEYSTP